MIGQSRGNLIFVDLEVAGAEICRPIIQVAAIAVANNLQRAETFEAKLTFDERLADPKSLTENRYCRQTWATDARSATCVARDFACFLRRHAHHGSHAVAQLVAHNAHFDGPFLRAWFDRVGRYFPGDYRILCSVQRALWFFREHPQFIPPPDYKLGTLCDYFGVYLSPVMAHTALADVRATVEVYRRMTLLSTAESASRINLRRHQTGRPRRVSRVAQGGRKACRSRRKPALQACRSRRRHFRQPQP